MPRFDGTGPMGRGAMTGRGAGRCGGNNADPASSTGGQSGSGIISRFTGRRSAFKFSVTGTGCGRGFRAGCRRRNNAGERPGY